MLSVKLLIDQIASIKIKLRSKLLISSCISLYIDVLEKDKTGFTLTFIIV